MTTLIVRSDEGRHHPMIDGDHVAKAAVSDTQGSFEVFEIHAPLLPAAPPHISPWTGVLYLLEGRVHVRPGGRPGPLPGHHERCGCGPVLRRLRRLGAG